MTDSTTTRNPGATAPGSSGRHDLDAVLNRVQQLDDGQLQELSRALDEDLADAHVGPLDDGVADLVCIAAAARITLRHRRAAAGRQRAADRIHRLMTSATESK